ncbi:GAF domain-containing protein [Hymenobacter properus]|uniref:GAF domain-containing protein n=1 Tax=Hymenobacter properus TaxID=2791026 RepID=A0A931BM96_9BACT|nr:GAF domain-containing protein [Hymenobacter properus]MBF9142863.1 GAF domain-containing protein [Hymenobacter properus]MBR7721670.1 GAF domain-containing protein [Microvirga sp. SRT04]
MSAPASLVPSYEAERLQSLRHYNFLAGPPDDVFYAVVALAAQVFGQPLSFVALVDAGEVIFPVQHGSGPMPSVPRAQALCSSAILAPGVVAYENLTATALTGADAPAIGAAVAQGNAFYAAAPLRMPDGYQIGVLCLMGPQPRSFSQAEAEVLEAMASVFSVALGVRHLCLETPELGSEEWAVIRARLGAGLAALHGQAQELLLAHGAAVPVPAAVLEPLRLGLLELNLGLAE